MILIYQNIIIESVSSSHSIAGNVFEKSWRGLLWWNYRGGFPRVLQHRAGLRHPAQDDALRPGQLGTHRRRSQTENFRAGTERGWRGQHSQERVGHWGAGVRGPHENARQLSKKNIAVIDERVKLQF